MTVDFQRWAVVAHKDDTGFGRQAADLRATLRVGTHIVVPSERLSDHPINPATDRLLLPTDPVKRVAEVLHRIDGIIFPERPAWHPALLATARKMGVKTVCIPNWEWFDGRAPEWAFCDFFACPARFTETVVRGYGWQNTCVLPPPLNLAALPVRRIEGPARTFIHNAGLVDHDDRKGTRDTIEAFKRVRRDDLRLIVRLQKNAPLPSLDPRITVEVGNVPDAASLYIEGDCAIQPSKMEGVGYMVLEPVCCGLPVITCDYPPMNEFVRQPAMRAKLRWFKRRAFPTAWVKHAHLRLPRIADLARRIETCAAQDLAAISRENRAWAVERFDEESLRQNWRRALSGLDRCQ